MEILEVPVRTMKLSEQKNLKSVQNPREKIHKTVEMSIKLQIIELIRKGSCTRVPMVRVGAVKSPPSFPSRKSCRNRKLSTISKETFVKGKLSSGFIFDRRVGRGHGLLTDMTVGYGIQSLAGGLQVVQYVGPDSRGEGGAMYLQKRFFGETICTLFNI
jgi:hypothetical protein